MVMNSTRHSFDIPFIVFSDIFVVVVGKNDQEDVFLRSLSLCFEALIMEVSLSLSFS